MPGWESRDTLHEDGSIITNKLNKDMSKLVSEANSIRENSTLDMSTLNSDSSTLCSDPGYETEAQLRQRLLAEFEVRTRECTEKVDQFLRLAQKRRYERLKPC